MKDYRSILERKKGQRQLLEKQLHLKKGTLSVALEYKDNLEKSRFIIQEVAQMTQEQLRYHISEIVTLALAAVFDKPYEFQIEFVQKRNQTECDLWFVRNGEKIDPLTASGGGAVDIAAFALRASLWSLQRNRSILILDEPFRFLSKVYQPKACDMLQMISKRLGLQIIMVTHNEELIDTADKVFEVSIKRGISYVKEC